MNGSFVFASELTAIAALPDFCGKINKDVLDLYLIHGYIPAPYSIYEGIYKLEPGKILRLEKPYRDWRIETYWSTTGWTKLGIVASRQMQARLAPDVEIQDADYRLSNALYLLN